ncbi:hypothetical protein A3F59_02780 [Candidatus Roizmanbacteria bacterium RIFCSPHIGHO2_12_FULL_38_13]|nr:MAG: hypothetical protein A3F59_02780 [Candidatus Roizmanbacteria bacterium RIFCSPHIGHO2_12_FULL_38_13]
MPKLPSLKPRQVIKRFEKLGFIKDRQSGSHVILYDPKSFKLVVIPMHVKDVPKGTLHAILKQTGVNIEKFLK